MRLASIAILAVLAAACARKAQEPPAAPDPLAGATATDIQVREDGVGQATPPAGARTPSDLEKRMEALRKKPARIGEIREIELAPRYPWQDGDSFEAHFHEVRKGWSLKRLLLHSGLPTSHFSLESLIEDCDRSLRESDFEFLVGYDFDPGPMGGFCHVCRIRIVDWNVEDVRVETVHVSVMPR